MKVVGFAAILKKILADYRQYPKEADHNENEINSAVAIIFRPGCRNSLEKDKGINLIDKIQTQLDLTLDTELLFLKRSNFGNSYSGDICLPGGKIEQGESLFDAVVRQTYEETGIKLQENQLIGVLDQKIIARFIGKQSLVVYAYVFLLKNSSCQVHLNFQEISDYKWLPLRYFLQQHIYTTLITSWMTPQKKEPKINFLNQIEGLQWSAVDIGLGKHLYGLTLYILGSFISKLMVKISQIYSLISSFSFQQQMQQKFKEQEKTAIKLKKIKLKVCYKTV